MEKIRQIVKDILFIPGALFTILGFVFHRIGLFISPEASVAIWKNTFIKLKEAGYADHLKKLIP